MVKKSSIVNYKRLLILFSKKKHSVSSDTKNMLLRATSEQNYRARHALLQHPKEKAFKTQYRNRCWKTYRARSYYGFFGLNRMVIRELTSMNMLPGVSKNSW